MQITSIPSYCPEYFVDRERALNSVLDKVQHLLRGESIRNRTTTFLGPRGSGKSWLLREIYAAFGKNRSSQIESSLYL